MTKYIVRAFDKTSNEFVEFNQNITKTLEDARKLAEHLILSCNKYFSQVTVEKKVYKLISSEIVMKGDDV